MRSKYPFVHYKKGENVWVTYTKKRVFKDNNCMNLVLTGMPGSGKSWGMLSYFCLLDPDFELEGNVFFRARNLLGALKDGNFKRGKIWGFEECGIDANNLNYFDVVNKSLNALFQTARHRNYVFGLNLPFINMLSKGVRTLMTAQWEAQGWDKNNHTIILPRTLEYNPELDKFYKKRLVVLKDGDMSYCNKILLPKPRKDLIRDYEKIKKEFTQDLYERLHKEIIHSDLKGQEKSNKFTLTDPQEVILGCLKEGLNAKQIQSKLNISERGMYFHFKALTNKGIVIKGVKDENNTIIRYDVMDKRQID